MSLPLLHVNIARRSAVMPAALVIALLLITALASTCLAADIRQKSFRSPDEAVQALVTAIRGDDEKALLAILGPGSRELISSGDSVADNNGRDRFVAAYEQKHSLKAKTASAMILQIGDDEWSLPIPIVKKGREWVFDSAKGKRELLNRRIGRNELQVIEVIDAYVDAQQEYASKDCRGAGKVEFAQRLISTPGNHDGLFWETKAGEQESPLGPLIARAAKEGYATEGNLSPFHGYYFKILKGQGKHANGGTYNYVVKDKMILGFAVVAYPAEYGNSGVMTFLVNQEGVIYEKNLGKGTRRIAEAITVFNPDRSWKKVKRPETPVAGNTGPTGTKQP
ncbi:MAG: DUF2950 domain-containing protein [Pseudomonadota bacterium]